MPEIRKRFSLPKLEYHILHLTITSTILPVKLTSMEIEVLAHFMCLEGDVSQYRFGPTGKKLIMQQLELSAGGLSNYITSLTTKGFLTKAGDMIHILPLLLPDKNEQTYMFKLVNSN